MKSKYWLFSRSIDLWVLFLPVWICWVVAFLLPESTLHADLSVWVFVLIIIGIDVSHVWSTIFRTYLDKEEFQNHRKLLIFAPIIAFALSYLLASASFMLFWRCLAYVAVFHFIKQQYGFMRIYKARSGDFRKKIISDNLAIYLSMLFPVFYWHINLNREFAWFVSGDFIQPELSRSIVEIINLVGIIAYFAILTYWMTEEIIYARKTSHKLPIGKILWILTTAGNWYIGIVYFNSDLVFTITNVVAHGLPYFALIIFYQNGKARLLHRKSIFSNIYQTALIVIGLVLVLAFTEEYLWDALVYRENETLFSSILQYPFELPAFHWQVIALALLSVPQITHYIVDGYIWKGNSTNPHLKDILLK